VTALLDPRPLEDALVDVVRLGGDTDTNAAIAGGLLGLRDGAAAIPARWVERLQFAGEFQAAAGTLASEAGLL
jgi:ADP-ribosylglycohydrolase